MDMASEVLQPEGDDMARTSWNMRRIIAKYQETFSIIERVCIWTCEILTPAQYVRGWLWTSRKMHSLSHHLLSTCSVQSQWLWQCRELVLEEVSFGGILLICLWLWSLAKLSYIIYKMWLFLLPWRCSVMACHVITCTCPVRSGSDHSLWYPSLHSRCLVSGEGKWA